MKEIQSNSGNSVDRVFEDIKSQIEDNKLLPGDKMPSENSLAERYGVSRLTIRAALQKLSAFGLIATKNGDGTYVSKFNFSNLISNVSGVLGHNISLKDVDQFRHLIEVASLNLLRNRQIYSTSLRDLNNAVKKMQKAAEKCDSRSFARADFEFHMKVCKISGNKMFVYAYQLIEPIMTEYFEKRYDTDYYAQKKHDRLANTQEYYDRAVDIHRSIIADIESGNIDHAIELIDEVTASAD